MKLRNMTCIYVQNNGRLLMMYKTKSRLWVTPKWSGIGGHFEEHELNQPDKCIIRELYEEANITQTEISPITLKYITIRKTDTEIRQQYIYFAELIRADITLPECGEGEMEWVDLNNVFTLPMSFTNFKALEHYYGTGRNTDEIYVVTVSNKDGKPTESIDEISVF